MSINPYNFSFCQQCGKEMPNRHTCYGKRVAKAPVVQDMYERVEPETKTEVRENVSKSIR